MELITELRKLGLTFDQCCEVEQLLAPKGVCISLFHGRNSPNEELEDWGFDGAVIMNVGFSWTYGGIKIHEVQPDGTFGEMVLLPVYEDMIVLDNKYYGDFEICTIISPIANNPARTKITFHELKALIEKNTTKGTTDVKKEAIEHILAYSLPQERTTIEQYLHEEVDSNEDFENMTDEDLYNYCAYNNVAHVWCHLYLLSL